MAKKKKVRKSPSKTEESKRLDENLEFVKTNSGVQPWQRWGPYVSERSWGTVREDYSEDGSAWDYLPHDVARSKNYRWGEDGIRMKRLKKK